MSNGTDPAPAVPQPSVPPPPPPPPAYPPAPKPYLLGIEPQMAKMILAAGIVLYLLVCFVENGTEKKLAAKRAEFEAMQIDKPVKPTEPDPPSEGDYKDKDKDKDMKEAYDAAKKVYDEDKKKYDEKMKDWNKDNVDWLKDSFDRKKDQESLQRDAAKLQAGQGSWAYFKFLLKFLASLAIVLGLVHFLFHGADCERAVALFLLGTMAVRLLS